MNKDTLKEAIGKAEALDLTQYKEEGKAEFNAALQNAKAVLEKADADQDEIDQATLALNTAIQMKARKARTRRLIQEGAVLEKVLPEVQAVGLDNLEEYLRRKLAGHD